jgi:hypothetical protein
MLEDVALIFICTGEKYREFLEPAIAGAKKFFPAQILLFTDSEKQYDVAKQVKIPSLEWPEVTLKRYHLFASEKDWLLQFKYVLYLDMDMKICKSMGYEIFGDGITVIVHSGFVNWCGYPEENPISTAYLPTHLVRTYVSGAMQGGTAQSFIEMSETIKHNIDLDLEKDYRARWYDESHLNRYIVDHPPAVVLPSKYHLYEQSDSVVCRINKNWQLPESHDWETRMVDLDVEKVLAELQV